MILTGTVRGQGIDDLRMTIDDLAEVGIGVGISSNDLWCSSANCTTACCRVLSSKSGGMAIACKNSKLFYAGLWYNRARRRNERPNGKMAGYIRRSYRKFQTPISPKCGLFLFINNHGEWQGLHIRATAPVFDPPAKIAVEDRGYLG
jgi:hypothetical protein